MSPFEIMIIALVVWNAAVFLTYGADKRKARFARRRISERTLMLSAAVMGAVGALIGMYVFRHKTKHMKFVVGVPLLMVLNTVIVIFTIRMI